MVDVITPHARAPPPPAEPSRLASFPPPPRPYRQSYAAWLGFYNSAKGMGWSKPELVQQANRFAGEAGSWGGSVLHGEGC